MMIITVLQVSHRKGLPHVIYCRVWRWPDLQSQLRPCPAAGPGCSVTRSVLANPASQLTTDLAPAPRPEVQPLPQTSSTSQPAELNTSYAGLPLWLTKTTPGPPIELTKLLLLLLLHILPQSALVTGLPPLLPPSPLFSVGHDDNPNTVDLVNYDCANCQSVLSEPSR